MHKIYYSPIQGYTDFIYRDLHNKHFGGITKYFTPYLRFEENKECKKSVLNDLNPINNSNINVVPQVLGTDINTFIEICKRIEDWGYTEINWNLGCPYPMATKRGFGSGILNNPNVVDKILENVLPKTKLNLSIKCRLGLESETEIFDLLKIYNKYPISEVIIHTRTASQMYKGLTNSDIFCEIINESKHKLIYNGDILKNQDIDALNKKFDSKIDSWMIGRGLLQNPFLAKEIGGETLNKETKKAMLKSFHQELFEAYSNKLQASHITMRMQTHWEYLSQLFINQHKIYKGIKKAKSISKYQDFISNVFGSEELV